MNENLNAFFLYDHKSLYILKLTVWKNIEYENKHEMCETVRYHSFIME